MGLAPAPRLPGEERPQDRLLPPETKDSDLKEIREFAKRVFQGNTQNATNSTRYIWRSFEALYRMYVVLFVIGALAAVAALIKGFQAETGADATGTLALAGLSAASFFALFLTRPLDSLERNSVFASWVTAATNTYWTRLMYFSDSRTIDKDLEDATADLVKSLSILVEKHAQAIAKYPSPQGPDARKTPVKAGQKGSKRSAPAGPPAPRR